MTNIEKLSDDQLVNLFKNSKIDKDLKQKIIQEIDKRDLKKVAIIQKGLPLKSKLFITFTSYFFYKYHLKESTKLLIDGNKKGYKQYWNYFSLGVFLLFIILLLLSKYIFRKLI
jgi:membrane-anchored protein YejM (alkaline phosphatase superfamily)